ncbi:MAG TPA: plasmid pRiA4b ORF-3 family protein [Pseudonocardiaceae bacterium]|nr:plasmid pRiA4b ORF-3 family protein [Pseudonocardiaceae bacterium]
MLRRADVPLAGRVLGVEMPQQVRSAADVPELQRPWTTALAIGLLAISRDRAVAGPILTRWPSATDDEVLDGWSRALAATLADTFDDDEDGTDALEIGRLALTVLATEPAPAGADLLTAINQTIIACGHALYRTFDRSFGYRDPAEVVLRLLAGFGAITGGVGRWRITPLGQWVLSVLGARGTALLSSPGAENEVDGVCQLKVTLRHVRPTCWRRVSVAASATLGDLHEIIQIAFAWDNDHLHAFTVGRRQYGDPYFDAEYDEDKITIGEVFARGRKTISYVYDFGDSWLHDIALETVVEPDPAVSHPECVTGRGDAPVEDSGEDEEAWIPFDRADINAQLARLVDGTRDAAGQLRDDVDIILTDAYGEAEQMTAFLTVLQEEISFPVPAKLLGQPIIVTGLTEDDATLELRARCRGKGASGLVSFAELEFRPGTAEAWLHAAYLGHLGRPSQPAIRPAGWNGLDHWRS